jgi:hypothetical protein
MIGKHDDGQYLALDHAVRPIVHVDRLGWVRVYVERMAWAPDALVVQPLKNDRVELHAVFRAGTPEFAFRTMSRVLAPLERGDV